MTRLASSAGRRRYHAPVKRSGLIGWWLVCGLSFLAPSGCGDGDELPSGRYIRGQVGASTARSGVAYFGDPSLADAVWVIPVHDGRVDAAGFRDRVELPIEADGSFLYTEDMGGYHGDALFALVDTTACSSDEPRGDWDEEDLDRRLGCIQGFVSISDAETGGALTLIPLDEQQEGVDLRGIEGAGEARSDTSLEQAAPSFSLDLESLRTMARVDERLLAFAYLYANFDDDAAESYNMHLLFDWSASLDQSTLGWTNPEALTTEGFYWAFDTGVDVDAAPSGETGYLHLYPPGPVTVESIPATFGPDQPLVAGEPGMSYEVNSGGRLAGGAGLFSGVSPAGEWKLRRYGADGPIVSKYELALSSPFRLVDGVPDQSYPTLLIPKIFVDEVDGVVASVSWAFTVYDGVEYVDVPAELAMRMIGSAQLGIGGDGSVGCPSDDFVFLELLGQTQWEPEGAYVRGTGDDTTCGITHVMLSYFSMGTLYQFFWQG